MSTLHRLGEAAIRRDLHRARVVLSSGAYLPADRRVPLCHHLGWLADLIGSEQPVVRRAADNLGEAVAAFREDPARPLRTEVIGALGSLHRASVRRNGWVSAEAEPVLAANTAWLLDGVTGHLGAGLVVPAGLDADGRSRLREQVDQYRRRRLQLWGPVVLDSGALVR